MRPCRPEDVDGGYATNVPAYPSPSIIKCLRSNLYNSTICTIFNTESRCLLHKPSISCKLESSVETPGAPQRPQFLYQLANISRTILLSVELKPLCLEYTLHTSSASIRQCFATDFEFSSWWSPSRQVNCCRSIRWPTNTSAENIVAAARVFAHYGFLGSTSRI